MANQASSLFLILALTTTALAILGSTAVCSDMLEPVTAYNFGGTILENGDYKLRLQDNCELVILKNNETVIWTSGSKRSLMSCSVAFQPDGNLVIYNYEYGAQWATGTNGETAHYLLALTASGNLAIYKTPIWETKTGSYNAMEQEHRKVGPQSLAGVHVPRTAENVIRMFDAGRAV